MTRDKASDWLGPADLWKPDTANSEVEIYKPTGVGGASMWWPSGKETSRPTPPTQVGWLDVVQTEENKELEGLYFASDAVINGETYMTQCLMGQLISSDTPNLSGLLVFSGPDDGKVYSFGWPGYFDVLPTASWNINKIFGSVWITFLGINPSLELPIGITQFPVYEVEPLPVASTNIFTATLIDASSYMTDGSRNKIVATVMAPVIYEDKRIETSFVVPPVLSWISLSGAIIYNQASPGTFALQFFFCIPEPFSDGATFILKVDGYEFECNLDIYSTIFTPSDFPDGVARFEALLAAETWTIEFPAEPPV